MTKIHAYTDETRYDLFSKMSLDELIENERAALSMLDRSSEYINNLNKKDLNAIRKVMLAVHNYNWITKKVKVSHV